MAGEAAVIGLGGTRRPCAWRDRLRPRPGGGGAGQIGSGDFAGLEAQARLAFHLGQFLSQLPKRASMPRGQHLGIGGHRAHMMREAASASPSWAIHAAACLINRGGHLPPA
jgi:hypothetical protein